jgi:hypothetical protein
MGIKAISYHHLQVVGLTHYQKERRENELVEGIKKAAEGTKNSIQGGMVRNASGHSVHRMMYLCYNTGLNSRDGESSSS